MTARKNEPYKSGELEVILSLVPIAHENGPFGEDADIQEKKLMQAKKNVGIAIGRKQPRKAYS